MLFIARFIRATTTMCHFDCVDCVDILSSELEQHNIVSYKKYL